MRDRDALGQEGGDRHWGKLRARRNDLPHGPALHRTLERAGDVRAGRRKYWIPAGRRGDRFCAAGYESERGGIADAEQGEAWWRRVGRRRAEGTFCRSRYRCFHEGRDSDVLARTRAVRGDLAGRFNASPGWWG